METKIKYCGLFRDCDIEYVNEIKPDYIGFVFAKKGHRFVSMEKAALLKSKLDKGILSVGVFVNPELDFVKEICDKGIIDLVQLHGSEGEVFLDALRKIVSVPIIKAFRIESENDLEKAFASSADYLLLDNGSGGSGESFDWEILSNFLKAHPENASKPYFIAGGITKENAPEAIAKFHPYGLDLSSALETNKVKDFNKMKEFAATVRGVQRTEDIDE